MGMNFGSVWLGRKGRCVLPLSLVVGRMGAMSLVAEFDDGEGGVNGSWFADAGGVVEMVDAGRIAGCGPWTFRPRAPKKALVASSKAAERASFPRVVCCGGFVSVEEDIGWVWALRRPAYKFPVSEDRSFDI